MVLKTKFYKSDLKNIKIKAKFVSTLKNIINRQIKMKTLDKKLLERHDAREVIKQYTALVGQLADYERDMIAHWGQSIEAASQAKLKNPLLRR